MSSKVTRRAARTAPQTTQPTTRPSKSEAGAMGRLIPMGKGVAAGLLATTVLLLLFSFVMTKEDIPFSLVNPLSVGALIAGAMLASFMAARRIREKGMLIGIQCGTVIFLVLLLASFLTRFDVGFQAIIKYAVSAISGAIGGVLGVNAKTKRK